MATTLKINGIDRTVDVDGDIALLCVLRDGLGMTGTKFGCGMARFAALALCMSTVSPIRSGVTPIDSIGKSAITMIEAIGATPAPRFKKALARSGGRAIFWGTRQALAKAADRRRRVEAAGMTFIRSRQRKDRHDVKAGNADPAEQRNCADRFSAGNVSGRAIA